MAFLLVGLFGCLNRIRMINPVLGLFKKVQKTKQIIIINSTTRHNQSYRSRFTECQEHIVHPVQSLPETNIQHVQLYTQSLKPHSLCFSCFRGRGVASVPHTGEPSARLRWHFRFLQPDPPWDGWDLRDALTPRKQTWNTNNPKKSRKA